MNAQMIERFWSKVRKTDGCWEWQACLNEKGYGIFGTGGKKIDRAHRISYRLLVGPVPNGMFICHHCDNPACVRPDHLFVGTNRDNVDDMLSKSRNSPPPPMGGWNRYSYPDDVIARFGKESDAEIARSVGVTKYAIARARGRLGIPPLPSQTRFRKGQPHPRWGRTEVKHASSAPG